MVTFSFLLTVVIAATIGMFWCWYGVALRDPKTEAGAAATVFVLGVVISGFLLWGAHASMDMYKRRAMFLDAVPHCNMYYDMQTQREGSCTAVLEITYVDGALNTFNVVKPVAEEVDEVSQ